MWITPHGVLKAAQRNKATAQARSDGTTALTFSEPGRFNATVIVGADGLVQRVDSRAPDAVLGEVDVVTKYSNYRDVGGVKFPGRIEQSMAGMPVLDVQVREVEPNAAVDIVVPDAVRTATERVTTEKIADGVWFVGGGSHNSVAIEMKDHLVLVETPLNDGRSAAGDRGGESTRAGQADSATWSTRTSTSTTPAACAPRRPRAPPSSRRRPTCRTWSAHSLRPTASRPTAWRPRASAPASWRWAIARN